MATEFWELGFQLLSCHVSIRYEDSALAKALSYMAVSARQEARVLTTLSYTVTGFGPYEIREEKDLLNRAQSAEDVLFHIYGRVYARTLERYVLSGWVVWHAGLATIAGKKFMLVGNKGVGKTSLVTRLLFSGHQIEGDELTLARAGIVMSVPRRLHLKPGIENQVPELSGHLDDLPISRSDDFGIRAMDPTTLGFEWRISPSPVDRLIWISPNHGGVTKLESLGSFAMLQRLIKSYQGWGESRNLVLKCAAQLGRNGGHQLVLGSASEAVSKLEVFAQSSGVPEN